jgi:hypothetical protein
MVRLLLYGNYLGPHHLLSIVPSGTFSITVIIKRPSHLYPLFTISEALDAPIIQS